ncbi:MAG: glycosyltransferase family protein [Bacteroidota bacterium]
MLKYLFIIQGEGRGHLTQAICLKEILEARGHSIDTVLFGVNSQRPFPEYLLDEFSQDIYFFRSPNFVFTRNRKGIRLAGSLWYNLVRFPVYLKSIWKIRKVINQKRPDVVINFYDMLGGLAYYFSNQRAVLYAIGHHFLFEHPDFPLPEGFFIQKKLLILHNRITALKAKTRIALSFKAQFPFKNTQILPPLIRGEIRNAKSKDENFILVYLLNEGLVADLWSLFCENSDVSFILFYKSEQMKLKFPDNVKIKELNYRDFADYLRRCKGVICSAGFETVCEAAYLGKPVFLIPSENHFEQHGNLYDAKDAGIAQSHDSFESKNLRGGKNEAFRLWCKKGDNLLNDLLT